MKKKGSLLGSPILKSYTGYFSSVRGISVSGEILGKSHLESFIMDS
jgi:hypothetical protein